MWSLTQFVSLTLSCLNTEELWTKILLMPFTTALGLIKTFILTKSDKRTQPKIFWESCFVWPVCFPLFKECNIFPFFLQEKHVGQAEPDLQFILVVMSKYDSCLKLLFLVGAHGPAYLSKPDEFSLQLCLIEGGFLLLPDVKVLTSTARSDSL